MRGMTVSELIRRIVMEHIEEKSDLQEYEKAGAEYKKDPETFTLDDVIEELDLAWAMQFRKERFLKTIIPQRFQLRKVWRFSMDKGSRQGRTVAAGMSSGER